MTNLVKRKKIHDAIPVDRTDIAWQWFGNAGHFICGQYCRFHLCTLVNGKYLVSTVGQYFPDANVREVLAESRGFNLKERGDAREYEWLEKNGGYEAIGYNRLYETMVFRVKDGKFCDCGCNLPRIIPSELDMESYNDARAASEGHMRLCKKWSERMGEEERE